MVFGAGASECGGMRVVARGAVGRRVSVIAAAGAEREQQRSTHAEHETSLDQAHRALLVSGM